MDHSDSKSKNTLLPIHGLLFPISNKEFLYMMSDRQDNTYHGLCYTSCGALAVMKYISEDRLEDSSSRELMLYHRASSHSPLILLIVLSEVLLHLYVWTLYHIFRFTFSSIVWLRTVKAMRTVTCL